MNTKIIIATTIAALSLATTAFAESDAGGAQRFPVVQNTFTDSIPTRDAGAQQYQAYTAGQTRAAFDNTVLPSNGQNAPVQTANSLPKGFEDGTPQAVEAQSLARWYARQHYGRLAAVSGRQG